MAAEPPTVAVSGAQIAGESYTLTCQVTGGGTMTPIYQWFRNGSPVASQTSATLSFSPLRQNMDNGSYTCEATRSSTSVTSAGVSITVAGEFYSGHSYEKLNSTQPQHRQLSSQLVGHLMKDRVTL